LESDDVHYSLTVRTPEWHQGNQDPVGQCTFVSELRLNGLTGVDGMTHEVLNPDFVTPIFGADSEESRAATATDQLLVNPTICPRVCLLGPKIDPAEAIHEQAGIGEHSIL
jgi:hypothetical protein